MKINKKIGFLLAPLAITGIGATQIPTQSSVKVASNYSIKTFASTNSSMTQPDDIARLGNHLFIAFQNGIHPKGQPNPTGGTKSTIVEYSIGGKVLNQWSITGHCDGLQVDPHTHQLIATANEDGNSSLYTIGLGKHNANQVTNYHYSPTLTSNGTTYLPSGGGTDSVSIYHGKIFVSASNPTIAKQPAVYQATLANKIATLKPVFFDNAKAIIANTNNSSHNKLTTLNLTDPDSNTIVPGSSPRFKKDFVLDSQGDKQQIYVHNAMKKNQSLHVLNLQHQINDTAWATSKKGTLFVTDTKDNKVIAITGTFKPGTAFVAVTSPTAGDYLGILNMKTGKISPFDKNIKPQGLLFIASKQ